MAYNLPSNWFITAYMLYGEVSMFVSCIFVSFTIFVIVQSTTSSFQKYSYFLVNHLAWCYICDIIYAFRAYVSLGSNQCNVFFGFISSLDYDLALYVSLFGTIAAITRAASEEYLLVFRFLASIRPSSRCYLDVHSVPTWRLVIMFIALTSVGVFSFLSRIFNTKTTFAERLTNLSRDDAVLSRLSTTYLILCFDGEVVSSQALLTGIYFLALVALVLLITFYNIKTSTASSSAQRIHWMLFYALLAQCIAHSLTISIPAIVLGVTQNSPQAPLISMLCVLAGFFNTYANCFIFLLVIKPYRVYSKRILLSVFKSNKVAEIRPQAAPIQTQTTSEAPTIVQVEQPTH